MINPLNGEKRYNWRQFRETFSPQDIGSLSSLQEYLCEHCNLDAFWQFEVYPDPEDRRLGKVEIAKNNYTLADFRRTVQQFYVGEGYTVTPHSQGRFFHLNLANAKGEKFWVSDYESDSSFSVTVRADNSPR